MAKYKIAWLPGDGIGQDVMEAARIVLDRVGLDAEYIPGDIGWEFWCREGEALPARTIDLMKGTDCALFGAITSKGKDKADKELAPELQGKGYSYRSPIVRMRQLLDLYICLRPCKAYPGNPLNYKERDRPGRVPREHRGHVYRRRVPPRPGRVLCRQGHGQGPARCGHLAAGNHSGRLGADRAGGL